MLPQLAPPPPPPSSKPLTSGSFGQILLHPTSPPTITKQISTNQNTNSRTTSSLSSSFFNEVLISNLLNPFIPHLHTNGITLQNTFHPYTLDSIISHFYKIESNEVLDTIVNHIVHSLISILKNLHSINIYHNDIKPQNICYTTHLTPILIDFTLSTPTSKSLGGTKQYRPPECFEGVKVDDGDWFGVGGIGAEGGSRGWRGIDGSTEIEVMTRHGFLDVPLHYYTPSSKLIKSMLKRGKRQPMELKDEGGAEVFKNWWMDIVNEEEKEKKVSSSSSEDWTSRLENLNNLVISCS